MYSGIWEKAEGEEVRGSSLMAAEGGRKNHQCPWPAAFHERPRRISPDVYTSGGAAYDRLHSGIHREAAYLRNLEFGLDK